MRGRRLLWEAGLSRRLLAPAPLSASGLRVRHTSLVSPFRAAGLVPEVPLLPPRPLPAPLLLSRTLVTSASPLPSPPHAHFASSRPSLLPSEKVTDGWQPLLDAPACPRPALPVALSP